MIALCIYSGQLEEMTKATTAATEANTMARETAHLNQRAWVAPAEVTSKITEPGSKLKIHVLIKNTGNTFARKVAIVPHIQMVPKGMEPSFKERRNEHGIENILLVPNQTYDNVVTFTDPLGEDWIGKIARKEWNLVVFGWVTYYDIFDCDHWTLYCRRLDPDDDWNWNFCAECNDADNNRCP